ncbi:MAG: GNAT family N-acetyltransferase [Pseudomonadota bacterium]|nr:GNAT family N-acetyltransferase [Pseudomonadota bacterium]
MNGNSIRCVPLTPDRQAAFEALMGPRGGAEGCWCMTWRLRARDYRAGKGMANRDAFRRIVADGPPPGVLAMDGGMAVGWCAVAPRPVYVRLEASRILEPVDDRPVWSVSCFLVAKDWRGRGVGVRLLEGAAGLVRGLGGTVLEGYPVEPADGVRFPAAFAWTGYAATFRDAGFTEVARRSPTRPIMRLELDGARA